MIRRVTQHHNFYIYGPKCTHKPFYNNSATSCEFGLDITICKVILARGELPPQELFYLAIYLYIVMSPQLLQRALCSLFESGDMSQVKRCVSRALARLARGELPPQELFFTREYRGAAGYRPNATAPPNEIAKYNKSKKNIKI